LIRSVWFWKTFFCQFALRQLKLESNCHTFWQIIFVIFSLVWTGGWLSIYHHFQSSSWFDLAIRFMNPELSLQLLAEMLWINRSLAYWFIKPRRHGFKCLTRSWLCYLFISSKIVWFAQWNHLSTHVRFPRSINWDLTTIIRYLLSTVTAIVDSIFETNQANNLDHNNKCDTYFSQNRIDRDDWWFSSNCTQNDTMELFDLMINIVSIDIHKFPIFIELIFVHQHTQIYLTLNDWFMIVQIRFDSIIQSSLLNGKNSV
jgi:hypothetical protein